MSGGEWAELRGREGAGLQETIFPIKRSGRRWTRAWRWSAKGGSAVTDQGLFAGTNFVLNVLLARWLTPAEYGAFAIAYSVFLLLALIHSAVLLEPMMVFGSGKYFEQRKTYLGIVLRGHWLLAVPSGLLLVGAGYVLGVLYSRSAGRALCALGLVLPAVLLVRLTRQAFYVELQPARAAAGGAVYMCCLLAMAWWLHVERMLSPVTAVLAMGAAALVAGGLQRAWLHPRRYRGWKELIPKEPALDHWAYGRWALASALATWMAWNAYYLALPLWFGLQSAGALRALLNLVNPINHSMMAVGMLALPLFVRHREGRGLARMRQTVRRVAGALAAGSMVYFVILWLFGERLIHLLYAGRYEGYSGLPLLLAGLSPLAAACSIVLGGALNACMRPDKVFWGYLAAGGTALSFGLWLSERWGVAGALGGMLGSNVVLALTFWMFYRTLGGESAPA